MNGRWRIFAVAHWRGKLKQAVGGVLGQEFGNGLEMTGRIDLPKAFSHDIDLGSTDGTVHGRQLPIDIADADFIQINQAQMGDSGPGQRFRHPGSNAAQPDNDHSSGSQSCQGRLAIQTTYPTKSTIEIVHASKLWRRP
jgi:hypothetical protein